MGEGMGVGEVSRTNLKSVLESKRDLRVTDPSRVSSMEVGFEPLSKAQSNTP
jgi:hypothetical protein